MFHYVAASMGKTCKCSIPNDGPDDGGGKKGGIISDSTEECCFREFAPLITDKRGKHRKPLILQKY